MDGHGKLTQANGAVYEGMFKDGNILVTQADGMIYEGMYQNDKRQGQGK